MRLGPIRTRSWVLRCIALLFLGSILLFPVQLLEHFKAHFLGTISGNLIRDKWWLVFLNITVFTAFIIPLSFRRKADWKGMGLVGAFFVSLFVEMYGVPLTIFLASRYLGGGEGADLDFPLTVDMFGVDLSFTVPMIYSAVMMVIGGAIIIVGWTSLYKGAKQGTLVTEGIYSLSRHPQYLGFILMVGGWMLGWPTPLTLLLGGILIMWYLRVSRKEEAEMAKVADYAVYRERVPFML